MVIFSKVKLGVSPDINALATLIIGVVAIGILIAIIVLKRQEKRRLRDAEMAMSVLE